MRICREVRHIEKTEKMRADGLKEALKSTFSKVSKVFQKKKKDFEIQGRIFTRQSKK